jgi:hypothetical protein
MRCLRIIFGLAFFILFSFFAVTHGLAQGVESDSLYAITGAVFRVDPTSDIWPVTFSLLSRSSRSFPRIIGVRVNGEDALPSVIDSLSTVIVNSVKGLSDSQTEYICRELSARNVASETGDLSRLQEARRTLEQAVDVDAKVSTVTLATARLPVTVESGKDYSIEIDISNGVSTTTVHMTAQVRALPTDSQWVPADLHLHSTWSDGHLSPYDIKVNIRTMGYQVLYFTDHCDLTYGDWVPYSSELAALCDSNIKLYPGAEMTVVETVLDPDGEWRTYTRGDLLAHGIKDLTDILNRYWNPQTGINKINSNDPGKSSASIAHPYGNPSWTGGEVNNYRGYEIMSGLQLSFDENCNPVTKWKSELTRTMSSAFSGTGFPSPRTGSDWHQSIVDPVHPGYVTWIGTSQWGNKTEVDRALYNGYTIASRKGGLGYFTLSNGSTSKSVGQTWSGVPTGSTLTINVTFKPAEAGTYSIKVYQYNSATNTTSTAFSHTAPFSAGGTHQFSKDVSFPGSSNYYYLYISGPDYIYSSPIYVKN